MAVAKGKKELVESINKALKEIKEEGTYDKLIIKYFN
ncbi:MAG: transporter substrate-binding domain-containing protein [Cetobacterium sp.]